MTTRTIRTTDPERAERTPATALLENSVLLMLTVNAPSNRRTIRRNLAPAGTDPSAVNASKELLDSPELKRIHRFDAMARRSLYNRALPGLGTLKSGVYRLPLSLLTRVDEELTRRAEDRNTLIASFLDVYDEKVVDAQERLGTLYQAWDYPTTNGMRVKFSFTWRYLTVNVPETLNEFSVDLAKREESKAKLALSDEIEEIRQGLRNTFAELIGHAAERLGVNAEGKNIVFRDTLLTNMGEFFAYFKDRNVLDDTELEALVDKARDAMSGVELKDLRSDEDTRAATKATLDAIKAEMDASMMTAPSRKFDFGEDDDG